ncbi:MAG: S8 family peptidase, partial [Methanobacteriota archaeon]
MASALLAAALAPAAAAEFSETIAGRKFPTADPLLPLQWYIPEYDVPSVWALTTGSTGVKVAVIDTGIRRLHPDFAGVTIEMGHDFVQNDENPEDLDGHGTEMAGVIAAGQGNEQGIAGLANVTLHILRVNNTRLNCVNLSEAIDVAVEKGAHVINLSVSCDADFPSSAANMTRLDQSIHNALNKKALVVAAAKNNKDPGFSDCTYAPANRTGVIAVNGLNPGKTLAKGACPGSFVDLAAPGTAVTTTHTAGPSADLTGSVDLVDYRITHGNSIAAAFVTGIAALMRSRDVAGLDANETRCILENTATMPPVGAHDVPAAIENEPSQTGKTLQNLVNATSYGNGTVSPLAAVA